VTRRQQAVGAYPPRALPNLRKLRQVYLAARKLPLFAGISPDVKFLRFPEIVVAPGGRSRV
jgi:hypothetical protein